MKTEKLASKHPHEHQVGKVSPPHFFRAPCPHTLTTEIFFYKSVG